ncbi:MAG: hypothetical protein IPL86_02285 [Flavobacteriales bacterium]|nr:hypothetical protein [Flavobacteriales bacterium]
MNGNWGKVILFSILFCILGFILGRVTCGSCGPAGCERGEMHGDACKKGGACAHDDMKGEACEHGKKGKCCTMKGDSAMLHSGMDGAMSDSTAVVR